MTLRAKVSPVPCMHLYEYYHSLWVNNPQLGTKLLWVGYQQWAMGDIEIPSNNLYQWEIQFMFPMNQGNQHARSS